LPPICGFLGFGFFAFLMFTGRLHAVPLGNFGHTVAFFGLTIGGMQLPRLLLMHLLPARCPQCGGPAKTRGGSPITYRCLACGHVHQTSSNDGNFSASVGG